MVKSIRVSQTKSRIREIAFDRFVAALAADRQDYSETLDHFEVRFDGAVANLRRDAQDAAWREENRTTTIEHDPETNAALRRNGGSRRGLQSLRKFRF